MAGVIESGISIAEIGICINVLLREYLTDLRSSSLFQKWVKIITRPEWEAFLLFVLYFSLRWITKLKEFSTILFATAIMSIVKCISMKAGSLLYRLILWYTILCRKEYVYSNSERYGFTQHLYGLISFFALILFPIHLIATPFFLIYSYSVETDQTETNRMGWAVYHCCRFFEPLIRKIMKFPHKSEECAGEICYQCEDHSSFSRLKEALKKSSPIILGPMLLLFVFLVPSLLLLTVVSIIEFVILCACLFIGSHLFVLLILVGEIFSEVLELNLSDGYYEKILAIMLVIPAIQWIHHLGLRILVERGLNFMKKLEYNGSKSIRIVELFDAIPISVEQAALVLSGSCQQGCYANLSKEYLRLKISFQEEGESMFKAEILDKNGDIFGLPL